MEEKDNMTGRQGINYCTVRINDKECERCYNCIRTCQNQALTLERGIFTHNAYTCSYCYKCTESCPNQALTILEM